MITIIAGLPPFCIGQDITSLFLRNSIQIVEKGGGSHKKDEMADKIKGSGLFLLVNFDTTLKLEEEIL